MREEHFDERWNSGEAQREGHGHVSSEPTRSQPVTARIAPWLSVAHATQAVDYYKTAFGAVEVVRTGQRGGRSTLDRWSDLLGATGRRLESGSPGRQIARPDDLDR